MRHSHLLTALAATALVIGTPAWATSLLNPALAGQSRPAARTINTAKIFQSSMGSPSSGSYGQSMRAVEQQMIRSYEAGHINGLPIFVRPGGNVVVPLGQVLPVLQTAPGNFSTIVLGRNVHPVSIAGAPAAKWKVTASDAGHDPVLEIMPRFAGLHGSIQIVATSPHGHLLTYTIGLVSGKSRFTPELTFYRIPSAPSPSVGNPEASPPLPSLTVNATQAHVGWRVHCFVGDCRSIRPLSVVGNLQQTFIRLPDGNRPKVLVRNRKGVSLPVPYRMDGDTLVVAANPYQIDLITGTRNGLAEIRLKKEAGE
jgi:hypothetical protein